MLLDKDQLEALEAPVRISRRSVLIVDDGAEKRLALASILASPECRVVEAASGPEALRLLLREEFDVVLLDVEMPEMDGFEVATLMRHREHTRDVPILFTSPVATEPAKVHQGYSLGAIDYLVEPIDPVVVRGKVAMLAEISRARREMERQALRLVEAERREREHELAELRFASERHYRNLAESVPHIVWTAHPDGSPDYFNRGWFEYTGRDLADTLERGWLASVHAEDAPRIRALWEQAIGKSTAFETDCRLLRASDTTFRWHLWRAVPELDARGALVSWLCTLTDLDDRKRFEAALVEFKRTLDTMTDAVWIFESATWQLRYVNRGASVLLGWSAEELSRMRVIDLLPAYDDVAFARILSTLPGCEGTVLETVGRRKDGVELPVELSLQHVALDGGRFVSVARDNTERLRYEEERARLYREAQDAIRIRDDFLSIAAHELRTPLSALQLSIENVLRHARRGGEAPAGAAPVPIATRLDAAERQVKRLTRLVNELLDVSRMGTETLTLAPVDTDLAALVRDIVSQLAVELDRARCTVELRAESGIVGRWDANRLEQVVTNLLSNAMKFGAGKPIEITAARAGDRARLVVRDHGIGIAPEDTHRILERYERAVSPRHFGGLGLGLYVVRQIVDAHGGSVVVESHEGEGATVTVELPIGAAAR